MPIDVLIVSLIIFSIICVVLFVVNMIGFFASEISFCRFLYQCFAMLVFAAMLINGFIFVDWELLNSNGKITEISDPATIEERLIGGETVQILEIDGEEYQLKRNYEDPDAQVFIRVLREKRGSFLWIPFYNERYELITRNIN